MVENVSILNKKNLKLAAVIHRPEGQGKYPAVILLHGFTGNKEEAHIKQMAEDLAANNITAIRFDASGYAESEGILGEDYRLSNHFSDTESVYEYLSSLPDVDREHIGLFGQSLGAMLVVLFAARHPELSALVSVSPLYNFEAHYKPKGILEIWKKNGSLEKKRKNGGSVFIPYAFAEDALQYNALEDILNVRAAILFVLGTADINVLPQETELLFQKAREPKELFSVEGMDHYYKNFPDKLAIVNTRVLEFYKKYL